RSRRSRRRRSFPTRRSSDLALEVEELLLVPVALEHDVLGAADPLDLLERGLQLEEPQVVQGTERDDEVEVVVRPRVRVLRAVPRSEEHTSELQSRVDLVCRL